MQTFLPYPDFDDTARCLDQKRLGNQRLEAKVILKTLLGESDGWKHHPAVKMWRGHELQLAQYGAAMCCEWVRRGFKDTQLSWFVQVAVGLPERTTEPPWLRDERLHASHRSNLLRKKPEYYAQFGWEEPSTLPYYWP